MDEVRRGELHRLMDALVDATELVGSRKYADARRAIIRWVEGREDAANLSGYREGLRDGTTSAKGAGDE